MENKRFNSLNEAQAIQNWWEKKLVESIERNPNNRFQRFMEEVNELHEAILDLDGSFEKNYKAGLELADVFIIGFSIADALGFDIERLIDEKLSTVFKKYNPCEAQKLRESGLTWQETIKVLKERWRENE